MGNIKRNGPAMTSLPRYALVLFLSTLAGCVFSTKGIPKHVEDLEMEMANKNVAFASAYSAFVFRAPGLTITGSMSHLPGQRPLSGKPEASFRIPSSSNAPSLSFNEYPNSCNVSTGLAASIRTAVDEAFGLIDEAHDWRSIDITMNLVPDDTKMASKMIVTRLGNHTDLRFFFRCSEPTKEHDVFVATLTSIHETSHMMLSLLDLDSKGPLVAGSLKNEQLAEGGPACIFSRLQDSPIGRSLLASEEPDAYFNRSWQLGVSSAETRAIWCNNWVTTFRSSPASESRASTSRSQGIAN